MSKSKQHEGFESKVRSMADGFRGMREQGTQLIFKSESMVPMQAAQRLQVIADHFQSIRDAEETRQVAVNALEEQMDGHRAFYAEAVEVVKAHFGSDHRRLGSFGLGGARKPSRRGRPQRGEREVVRSTVVEEVIVDGEAEEEVIRTEEVITTIEPERRGRRRERERTVRAKVPATPDPVVSPVAPVTTKKPSNRR